MDRCSVCLVCVCVYCFVCVCLVCECVLCVCVGLCVCVLCVCGSACVRLCVLCECVLCVFWKGVLCASVLWMPNILRPFFPSLLCVSSWVHSIMTIPLENIIAILLPGTKKRETTQERFEAIWGELTSLEWKSKKSARYDWVYTAPYPHSLRHSSIILIFTLGLPPSWQYRVDVCNSCRRDCSGYGPGHVPRCRCGKRNSATSSSSW